MSDTKQPPIGECARCRQVRPLWRYVPLHTVHAFEPDRWQCRWCARTDAGEKQPLLCPRCWSAESEEEHAIPLSEGAAQVIALMTGVAR